MEPMMLKINLSNRSHEIEEIPKSIIRKYIGGRGLGSYLLYKSVPAKADPLGEENHLIFTAGPASGTNFHYSSKANLNTKSPLTGIYLYTVSSGILAHQMRKAGFWAIDIEGIADSPTYIVINNQQVEFRDAVPLWGMETSQVQGAMLGDLPSGETATVAIGTAGEKLVRYAAVFCEGDLYRCFGRGGAGCVMGSKKLKGMVVAGNGEVEIGDKITVKLCSNPTTGFKWKYETIGKVVLKEEDYDFEEPDKDVVGADGKEVWTFEAIEKGTTEIRMEYSRPWEGGEKAEWTYTLYVTVK